MRPRRGANDQTAGHCGNIAAGNIANQLAAGDMILRGYATLSTPADFLIGGCSGTLSVPLLATSDPLTVTYGLSNPAIIGRSFQCFEVSENVFITGEPLVDGTQFVWFPGMAPAPPATP